MTWWDVVLYLGAFFTLLGILAFAIWVIMRPRPAGGWRDNGEGE